MVAPLDKQYDTLMKSRKPQDYRYHKYEFFTETTKNQLGRLFRLIIENEKAMDRWKKKLGSMPRFVIREIFDRIDIAKKNYLIREDVI